VGAPYYREVILELQLPVGKELWKSAGLTE
jgi:hypothetical protein